MKKIGLFIGLMMLAMLWGCGAAMGPPGGMFYTGVEANQSIEPATDAPVAGKVITGESCAMGILGIAAWGDAGLDAALVAAGHKGEPLKNVVLDHSVFDVLHLYTKYCTQVMAYVAEEEMGEPDEDGDRIPDSEDDCPELKGKAEANGCPTEDSDDDGVPDYRDECPDVEGLAKYKGCELEDQDEDGVADEEDKCPDVVGVEAAKGCLEISKKDLKKLAGEVRGVKFNSKNTKLAGKSKSVLKQKAKILKANPYIVIEIRAYTGKKHKADDEALEKRGELVKAYLVDQGVSIDQLKVKAIGLGKGKKKSHRIEFVVAD